MLYFGVKTYKEVLVEHKAEENPTNEGLNSLFLPLEEKFKEHSFKFIC